MADLARYAWRDGMTRVVKAIFENGRLAILNSQQGSW